MFEVLEIVSFLEVEHWVFLLGQLKAFIELILLWSLLRDRSIYSSGYLTTFYQQRGVIQRPGWRQWLQASRYQRLLQFIFRGGWWVQVSDRWEWSWLRWIIWIIFFIVYRVHYSQQFVWVHFRNHIFYINCWWELYFQV